ncbi:hypothetical protein TNCV_484851 [Trichonephila clavipes]|nr:hypothetical protein TNCV_484851 [Trichonephila clavipes]
MSDENTPQYFLGARIDMNGAMLFLKKPIRQLRGNGIIACASKFIIELESFPNSTYSKTDFFHNDNYPIDCFNFIACDGALSRLLTNPLGKSVGPEWFLIQPSQEENAMCRLVNR